MNVLAINNRVRFTLSSMNFGSIIIDEPEGWENDDKEFTRNEDYHGVFVTISNNLSFIGDAVDFIQLIYEIDGINADVRLIKEERHPITDEWIQIYSGYLDITTYQFENNKVKLKFNSGGLESLIKSRESQMVEIERTDSIDGTPLTPIETVNLNLPGRNIFLESVWEVASMNYQEEIFVVSRDGNERSITTTIPLDLIKKSHEQANSIFIGTNSDKDFGVNTMMLLNNIDRPRQFTIKVSDLTFNCRTTKNQSNWAYLKIALVKYTNGTNYNTVQRFDIWNAASGNTSPPIFGGNYGGTQTVNKTINISLIQNESLGIEILLHADLKNGSGNKYVDFWFQFTKGKVIIQEESSFDPSNIKAVKPFNLVDRILTICTNKKNVIKSDILQSGVWKDLLISHGFWIRGFSNENDLKLLEEDRKYKPLTTSFKDFIDSFSAVCNLGMGIERNGYQEKIRIEKLSYFYNRNVTIKLHNPIKNVKRSIDVKNYFKSIEIGYEKGGEYEEAMGLDEFNVKNTYTTVINKVSNVYNQASKYRADSYGAEFARRKDFITYNTEDTSYDQDVFFFDAKPIGRLNTYTVRLWQMDYLTKPTGIYSPETAYNLRISPFNNMLRHGWILSAGLIKYPIDYIKYSSSTGNSSLRTTFKENGTIQNNLLSKPHFIPEIIEFDHEVNFETALLLNGKSIILNEEIPNVYGLIEFINEKNEIERGYLLSVKPNGEGKWKILKANR